MLSATYLCLNKGSSNLLSPESGEHIPTKPQNLDRILNIYQFSCIGFSNLLKNINKILAVGAYVALFCISLRSTSSST